jgi:hypothetical protein
MKGLIKVLMLAGALQVAGVSASWAQNTRTYQVTGPVLEVTDKTIVVQKGNDRWELARDEKTQVDGELKVGSKVTIQYKMIAVSVEAKGEKKKKAK